MGKGTIRLHDKLSSGGEVISASSTMIIDGIKAALLNDLVSCPIEGHGVNRIVGTSPEWQSDSEHAAFDGALEAGDSRHDVLNNYKTSFDEFSNSAEGESALKGTRIKLMALIFNCWEYASLLEESKGDAKSRAQITSAFLGTLSTASEIVEPMVKHGLQFGAGATSVKFVGATAGTGAAVINLALDAGDLISEIRSEHTRWIFVGLNSGKTAVDAGLALKGASGLLQVLAETELFERGWLTQLSSKLGEIAAGQFVSFLASWEAMIGIFLIEQLVIYYYGNELQKWCRNGVFGLEPNDKLKSTWQLGYKKPCDKECDNQREAFNRAGIYAVLFISLKFFGADWKAVFFCLAIAAAMLVVAVIYTVFSIRKKPNLSTLLTESIFTALNFSEPRRVDLRKITKEQAKKMPPVADREMPSSRSTWMDFFYYY